MRTRAASSPGTKSLMIDPAGVRLSVAAAGRPGRDGQARRRRTVIRAPGVLQGGDQREGGLGALVEVGPVRGQPVVAAAGRRIPHRRADVVVAEEPADRLPHAGVPAGVAGDGRRPWRRRRRGRRPRSAAGRTGAAAARRARHPPAGTTDSRSRRRSWTSRSQASIRRPSPSSWAVAAQLAGGDDHLGEGRVGVGQPLAAARASPGRRPGTPTAAAASASSAAARRGPGGRRSTSAAPSPAKAIACGAGDAPGGAQAEGDRAPPRGSRARGCGPRRCPAPTAPAPTSRRARARRSSAGRSRAGCGRRRRGPGRG